MFETPYQVQALAERAPYIAQAFINLAMLVTVCICGALLYTKNGIRTRRGLLITAAVSGVCAVLMHAMVYGIVIAVPAPYTLLTPMTTSRCASSPGRTPRPSSAPQAYPSSTRRG